MSNTVIKVENLTKEYKIMHETKDPYAKFSDAMIGFAKKLVMPWKFFKTKEVEMFKALNDVNFEIKKGEKIAIIGRNGAGKSTLLKVLSRITEPTNGSVKIKGRVASLLEVGTGFHPELTGRENIFLNGAILGMTKKEITEKFDDIVEFSGCEKFLDTPVKRYSSGMRVRLGFAVAAHLESEILIVDEVLAVGDAEFQKKCLGKMDEISKGEGRTIIFVSHNMSAVQNLCDKGIVMEQGQVKFAGDIDEAIESYLSFFDSGGDYRELHKDKAISLVGFDIPSAIKYGSSLRLSFDFLSKEVFKKCFFDVAVLDSNMNIITHYKSNYSEELFNISKGNNKILLDFNGFNLMDSSCYLFIHLAISGGGVLYRADNIKLPTGYGYEKYVAKASKIAFGLKKEVFNDGV